MTGIERLEAEAMVKQWRFADVKDPVTCTLKRITRTDADIIAAIHAWNRQEEYEPHEYSQGHRLAIDLLEGR